DYNEENKNTIDNSNQIMLGLQFDCKHSTALSANTCVLADKMPFCSLSKLDKYCFPTNLDGNNLNNDGQCNSIGLSNDAQWLSFVAGYGNYSIQLIPANCKDDGVDFGTLRYALYGDCDLSDLVDCNTTCQPNEHFFIYSSNLTPGHRYFLAIERCESNSCQVSIKTQGVFTDYSADCKNTLEGTIYYDQDSDCNLSTNDQNALEGILVKANNGSKTYYTTTDINGYYQFNLPDGIYSLSVYTSGKTIDVCNTQDINDVNLGNVTEPINILLNQQIDCQELEVYINPGALRRCFNSLATIKITNDSDLLIEHATLYLDKSDKINISSANYPYTVQANGSLLFQNLIIYPKSKKNIIVNYSVDCNAPLNSTACFEAKVLPESNCSKIVTYDGAILTLASKCENNTVSFDILNKGLEDMSMEMEYFVYRNGIYYDHGSVQLKVNEIYTYETPADGATYNLKIDQIDNYPYPGTISTFVESCGNNINSQSYGYANLFHLDDYEANHDISCGEIIGSFDPNDKVGLP
ncbi:MAG TPA: carboxypeptidase-like regulatory domain-containing protein, partial [Saprospiraceae bacterium]|nr:carboxypeptidase-like regulatory domain-containing protein [Saprospiraceae bacterium]